MSGRDWRVLAPVVGTQGEHKKLLEEIRKDGLSGCLERRDKNEIDEAPEVDE